MSGTHNLLWIPWSIMILPRIVPLTLPPCPVARFCSHDWTSRTVAGTFLIPRLVAPYWELCPPCDSWVLRIPLPPSLKPRWGWFPKSDRGYLVHQMLCLVPELRFAAGLGSLPTLLSWAGLARAQLLSLCSLCSLWVMLTGERVSHSVRSDFLRSHGL